MQRLDLGLDPLGVPQQQIALFTRLGMPKLAVGLVGAHFLDPDAHGAQASERLQRVDLLLAIAAVSAARISGDRADQPDLLVVAQRRLTEPAAPGGVLNRQSCHDDSKTNLKRLKSRLRAEFLLAAKTSHAAPPRQNPKPSIHGSGYGATKALGLEPDKDVRRMPSDLLFRCCSPKGNRTRVDAVRERSGASTSCDRVAFIQPRKVLPSAPPIPPGQMSWPGWTKEWTRFGVRGPRIASAPEPPPRIRR